MTKKKQKGEEKKKKRGRGDKREENRKKKGERREERGFSPYSHRGSQLNIAYRFSLCGHQRTFSLLQWALLSTDRVLAG